MPRAGQRPCEFEAILQQVQPAVQVFTAARAMFKTLWDRRVNSQAQVKRALDTELAKIGRQVDQFLDRIADTDVPSIVAAYEKRIHALEEQKIVLSERIANCAVRSATSTKHFELPSTFSQVLGQYGFPGAGRQKSGIETSLRRTPGLHAKLRISNSRFDLAVQGFREFRGEKKAMARPAGLEPTTTGLEGRCSIQLSYGRTG